jgi:hypothetical protein
MICCTQSSARTLGNYGQSFANSGRTKQSISHATKSAAQQFPGGCTCACLSNKLKGSGRKSGRSPHHNLPLARSDNLLHLL